MFGKLSSKTVPMGRLQWTILYAENSIPYKCVLVTDHLMPDVAFKVTAHKYTGTTQTGMYCLTKFKIITINN